MPTNGGEAQSKDFLIMCIIILIFIHSEGMSYVKSPLRIDKGSRAVIYVIGCGDGTMTSTATIYISYKSSYFSLSVHVWYITFRPVL